MQELFQEFSSWIGKILWRRDRLPYPYPVFLGFPCGSAGKESACNAGDLGSIPVLGRSPGDGKDYPLQYSDLDMTEQLSLSKISEVTGKLLLLLSHFSRVGLCATP